MKRLFPLILSLLLFTTFSYGQDDKAYSNAIKKMYVVMGTDTNFKAVIKQMISTYKNKYPYETSWNVMEAELIKTSIDDLAEMMIPIYRRYLTLTDIEAITEFYKTPVGKKYVRNLPSILQESIQVGQEWGQKIKMRIDEKLKEEKK